MMKGSIHSDATKELMSESKKGINNPFYGKRHSDVTIRKLSEINIGKQLSEDTKMKLSKIRTGWKYSATSKRKMSESQKGRKQSEATKNKLSELNKGKPSPNKGKMASIETRKRSSATRQGISYDEWESFAKEQKYCPKFNENCKESNREKYGRMCFICSKTEIENGQRLSVHHVDMNKAQGCESNWKLVPLCKSCHSKSHNNELIIRLGYLLENEVK